MANAGKYTSIGFQIKMSHKRNETQGTINDEYPTSWWKKWFTLPETNMAPENGWLEY